MSIVTPEYIQEQGYLTENTQTGQDRLQEAIDTIEPLYLWACLGKTIADDVQDNPANYTELLEGNNTENLNDTYQGIKQDIAAITVIQYYSELGQYPTNTGFVKDDHKNSIPLDVRNLLYVISKRSVEYNAKTLCYLKDNPITGWSSDLFNCIERLSLWS